VKYANAVVAICCVGTSVLWPSAVMGDTGECGDPSRPWILVDFGVEPLRGLAASDVTAQLRAGLLKPRNRRMRRYGTRIPPHGGGRAGRVGCPTLRRFARAGKPAQLSLFGR
jgi:hypothetical protein